MTILNAKHQETGMSETATLEQVLADWRGDAQVLRRQGHTREAEQIERFAEDVGKSAHEYLTWLREDEAILRSARSRPWLRSQFPIWLEAGHARREGRARFYRMLIVPRRPNVSAAREAGRRAGLEGRVA